MILILIFILMVILLRQFSLALLCEVNLLVILIWAVGLYVLCGEKFNIITNTMGAILLAIAIAVDDTIHFIAWLRRNSGLKEDAGEAVIQTFADVGKPIVMTTLLLFCGFFVLFLGSILPTKMFGMLTAFAMGFAMIGDMFVLTPLVLIFKPKLPPLPVHGDN
ncbi:MAG: MMPL family transporter [Desulfobacterales bacterium]|nr:MMPL family transporter [Desulfobacterales bacterium]